jgi:hypothetical protein
LLLYPDEVRLGHVFVTSLVLGGQQWTSKYTASLEKNDKKVQEDTLRGAIGVKINAQYVSASVNRTKDEGENKARNAHKYSDLSYLGISTIGGNPLIGSE